MRMRCSSQASSTDCSSPACLLRFRLGPESGQRGGRGHSPSNNPRLRWRPCRSPHDRQVGIDRPGLTGLQSSSPNKTKAIQTDSLDRRRRRGVFLPRPGQKKIMDISRIAARSTIDFASHQTISAAGGIQRLGNGFREQPPSRLAADAAER